MEPIALQTFHFMTLQSDMQTRKETDLNLKRLEQENAPCQKPHMVIKVHQF